MTLSKCLLAEADTRWQNHPVNKNKNTGVYQGKRFWIGTASTLDGEIENVYTWEQAWDEHFRHQAFMSDDDIEGLYDGTRILFWMRGTNVISDEYLYAGGEWVGKKATPAILAKVRSQIQTVTEATNRRFQQTAFRMKDTGRIILSGPVHDISKTGYGYVYRPDLYDEGYVDAKGRFWKRDEARPAWNDDEVNEGVARLVRRWLLEGVITDDLPYLRSEWQRVKRANQKFWQDPSIETADRVITNLRDFLSDAQPYIFSGTYNEAKQLLDQMDKACLSARWPLNTKDVGRVNGTFDHIQDLIHNGLLVAAKNFRDQNKAAIPDAVMPWSWAA